MLESIISFSSFYWIPNSLWICMKNFFNLFKCRLFNEVCKKSTEMFVNNETVQKPITENLFSTIIVNFFLNLFLKNQLVYCKLFTTFFVVVIEKCFKNRFSKLSLKMQSMRILMIECALLMNKYVGWLRNFLINYYCLETQLYLEPKLSP